MPKRRRRTLLEDLPAEIIHKILVQLSSKDVGRYRAVSTSWRTTASTPQFMLEHHRRQPSLPIIHGGWRSPSFVVFRDAGAGTSSQLWPFLVGAQSDFGFSAACDGFLVLYHYQRSRYYICNPVIRKLALLPHPQCGLGFSNYIVGFYRYHQSGEYRVLWVSRSRKSFVYSLYVLTVGSDEPRQVTITMPEDSLPSLEQKLLGELCCSPKPLHHRGSLRWYPNRSIHITGGGTDIIVFDTEAESFRWMRSPTLSCLRRTLIKMNGNLALWGSLTSGFTAMDVWVMQDYEAEIWTFKYQIDAPTLEASNQLYLTAFKKKRKEPLDSRVKHFNDMVVLNERELLIRFNEKHVLRCDTDGKFLGMVNIGESKYCMAFTQHRLQESIIPIPSYQIQGEDEEPPFSTGLV